MSAEQRASSDRRFREIMAIIDGQSERLCQCRDERRYWKGWAEWLAGELLALSEARGLRWKRRGGTDEH